MADKEARVRLTLTSDQFLSKLSQATKGSAGAAADLLKALEGIETAADGAGKKGSTMGAAFSKSFGAVKSELSSMGSQIKSLIGTAATLGGAFSVGAALKNTVQLQDGFSTLALRMELTSKQTVRWQDLQKQAQAAASQTTRTTDEMRDSMARVYSGTGDSKFAAESMGAIGMAATATGQSVADLADMAGMLHKKFGTSAQDLPAMLERIAEQADAGGQSFDELKGSLEDMAAVAGRAGIKGAEGLTFMMQAARSMNDKLGAGHAAAGLKGIFETLENTVEKRQQLAMMLNQGNVEVAWGHTQGVRFGEKDDAFTKTRKVLTRYTDQGSIWDRNIGQRGGHTVAQFKDTFQGDSKRTMQELLNPFEAAFKAARAQGKSLEESRKIGTEAFDANIKKLSSSMADGTKLQKAAAAKAAEPAAQLRQALEALQQAFQKPEIVAAINDLAKALPELAKAVAPYLTWAAKNPGTAAAGAVGGRLAMAGGGALLGSALQGITSAISGSFAGKGEQVGAGISKTAGWAAAGGAIGAAAIAAFVAGKMAIDADLADTKKGEEDIALATAATAGNTSKEEKQKHLDAMNDRVNKLNTPSAAETSAMVLDDLSGGQIGVRKARAERLKAAEEARNKLRDQLGQKDEEEGMSPLMRQTYKAHREKVQKEKEQAAETERKRQEQDQLDLVDPMTGKSVYKRNRAGKIIEAAAADDEARRQRQPGSTAAGSGSDKDAAGAKMESAADKQAAAIDKLGGHVTAFGNKIAAIPTGGGTAVGGSNGLPGKAPTGSGAGT